MELSKTSRIQRSLLKEKLDPYIPVTRFHFVNPMATRISFFHSVLPTYHCLHLKYLQWKGYTVKEIKGFSENQRAKTQVIINHWTFPPENLVAFDLLHGKPRLPTVICPTKHRWRKRLNLLNYFQRNQGFFRKWKGKKRSDHQSWNFSTCLRSWGD